MQEMIKNHQKRTLFVQSWQRTLRTCGSQIGIWLRAMKNLKETLRQRRLDFGTWLTTRKLDFYASLLASTTSTSSTASGSVTEEKKHHKSEEGDKHPSSDQESKEEVRIQFKARDFILMKEAYHQYVGCDRNGFPGPDPYAIFFNKKHGESLKQVALGQPEILGMRVYVNNVVPEDEVWFFNDGGKRVYRLPLEFKKE
jgi:hypothetical protein